MSVGENNIAPWADFSRLPRSEDKDGVPEDDESIELDRSPSSGSKGQQFADEEEHAPDETLEYSTRRTHFLRSEGNTPKWDKRYRGTDKWLVLHRKDTSPRSACIDWDEFEGAKRRRMIETWTSAFDFTDYQQKQTIHLFDQLENANFGSYSLEDIYLALIAAVAFEEWRKEKGELFDPLDTAEGETWRLWNEDDRAELVNTDAFAEMATSVGSEPNTVKHAWCALSDRLPIDPCPPSLFGNS